MRKLTGNKSILLVVCLLVLFSMLSACGDNKKPDTSESPMADDITSIEVKSSPNKTEYFVGDTYDFSGGVLAVVKADGTTEEIPMTDPEVTYSATEAPTIGNKSITVTYGEKKTNVRFTVNEKGFVVLYDYNYDGAPEGESNNVNINATAEKPEDPTRDGYTFYKWYTDPDCTVEYNFETPITEDVTLFAGWQENGADYKTVSFDLSYYGCNPSAYTQIVKNGELANIPAITPERSGYTFEGWYADEAYTFEYDASEAVTTDSTIYAKWSRTTTEVATYTFEAELTDLTGKSGPGFSGTSSERNMIVSNEDVGASGNRYISYLYKLGNSIEFFIASDKDVSNVEFVASLSAEMADMTISPDNYTIEVNGTPLSYEAISFTNVPTSTNDGACLDFEEYTLSTNLSLNKGANVIKFITANSDNYVGSGTIAGTAPLIDCIKLTTDAILIWDGNYDLPMTSNFGGGNS